MSDEASPQQHYFSDSPASGRVTSTFTIRGPAGDIRVETSNGVFSSAGLDKGTAVLLDSLRRDPGTTLPAASVIVDVGCGVGPIALFLAATHPHCRVVAVDVNRRALELCAENARRNGLRNVECRHPEDIEPDLAVDLIVSNPPIRIGKDSLHELLVSWLARLRPGGWCRMVVGKNLGADSLATWLQNRGLSVTRLESKKGFRVLEVRHPRGESGQ